MILFITDVHCRYGVVNRQILHAEQTRHSHVSEAIVLGDFGLYEPFLRRFFRGATGGFLRPVSFIEGNHEDFDRFDRLVGRYRDHLTYLPRGSIRQAGGKNLLALGGVAYMDAHLTPERSVVKRRDIDRCLEHPASAVDIILSHDCPRGIGVTNTPGFEHYGEPGFAGGRELADHFSPAYWLFGHHHRNMTLHSGGTCYLGLPRSWEGYAVLSPGGTVELVEHHLAVRELPRSRLFRWLRR